MNDPAQIQLDEILPADWGTEKKPIETELKARIEWSNEYTGNYDYIDRFTKPSNVKDPYGNTKPAYKQLEKISPPPKKWEKSKGI